MKKDRVLKYISVLEFKNSLPLHERYIFDLYYNNRMSSRKIAEALSKEDYPIHFKSINSMVNSIKAKIKTQWK